MTRSFSTKTTLSSSVDNALYRADGTSGRFVQPATSASLDDNDNLSGLNELTASFVRVEGDGTDSFIEMSQSNDAPASPAVNNARLFIKNPGSATFRDLNFLQSDGTTVRIVRTNWKVLKNTTAPTDNALVRYDSTSGELAHPTTVIVDDADNMSGVNALTASSIANGAQYNGSTLLTSVTGVVDIDASLGPNYHMTLTSSVTFNNPLNAVAGQELVIVVAQDSIGARQTNFSAVGTNWNSAGQLAEIAASASSESIVSAVARDFGSGINWDYAISHGQTADGITDIAATLTTTGSGEETIAIVPMTLGSTFGVGVIDVSVLGMVSSSAEMAQFGMRASFYRSGSTVTNKNENFYSSYKDTNDSNVMYLTHSIGVTTISIKVAGSASRDVEWSLKGIFQEIS